MGDWDILGTAVLYGPDPVGASEALMRLKTAYSGQTRYCLQCEEAGREVERLKAEVERLKGSRDNWYKAAGWYLKAAKRIGIWRGMCLDEIADLKLSLSVFEQGAVVDAKYVANVEAEREAARQRIKELESELATPVLVATNRLADALADARAEAERLQGYLDEEGREAHLPLAATGDP